MPRKQSRSKPNSVAHPEAVESFWISYCDPNGEAEPASISFDFETSNHLRAERLIAYLRETSDCQIELADGTFLDAPSDLWIVRGQTRKQQLTKPLRAGLFRWLADAEQRFGVHLSMIAR